MKRTSYFPILAMALLFFTATIPESFASPTFTTDVKVVVTDQAANGGQGGVFAFDPTDLSIVEIKPGGAIISSPFDVASVPSTTTTEELYVIHGAVTPIVSKISTPIGSSPTSTQLNSSPLNLIVGPPMGITVDPATNDVIVVGISSTLGPAVLKIDPTGTVSTITSGINLVTPSNVAVDNANNRYLVTDVGGGPGDVIAIDKTSLTQSVLSPFTTPFFDISVSPFDGKILAASPGPANIIEISPAGTESVYYSDTDFGSPLGIEVDANGDVYLADPNASGGSAIFGLSATEPNNNADQYTFTLLQQSERVAILNESFQSGLAVSIDKTGPTTAAAGDTIQYVLTVTTSGSGSTTSMVIEDLLPPDADLVIDGWEIEVNNVVLPPPAICNTGVPDVNNRIPITCTSLGTITVGDTVVVTLDVIIDPNNPAGDIINDATVTTESASDNDSFTTTITAGSPDLGISGTGTPEPVTAGEQVTYTLSVTNPPGSVDATGVIVDVDGTLSGVTIFSVSSSQGGCTSLPCNLGNIPNNSPPVTVTVIADVDSSVTTPLSNAFKVDSDVIDADPTDNTVTINTAVSVENDLSFTQLTASPDPVVAGNDITYDITISNDGSSDAANVILDSILPTELSLESVSIPSCSDTLPCNLGTLLPNGGSISLTVDVNVDASYSDPTTTATFTAESDVTGSLVSQSITSGVTEAPQQIILEGIVRDFYQSHPDFEYVIAEDLEIVKELLGIDERPVYDGNPTTITTTGALNFNQWYNHVPGTNDCTTIQVPLDPSVTNLGFFVYSNDEFFPIDNQLFGNEGNIHNYHFTFATEASFDYNSGSGQTITLTGDDDIWLFINNQLVINQGGVLPARTTTINLDDIANDLGLLDGNSYDWELFFAERHKVKSELGIETNIILEPASPSECTDETDSSELEITKTGEFVNPNDSSGIIEKRVSQSSDDAEEDDGQAYVGDDDLDINEKDYVGLRFQDIEIPKDATITNAYVKFTVQDKKGDDDEAIVKIYGEDSDNASTFTSNANDISSRTKTTASITWDIPDWKKKNDSGPAQTTPNLSSIIQEIVNRDQWQSGNSIAILIEQFDGDEDRDAYAYDGSKKRAPLLHIEFEDNLVDTEIVYTVTVTNNGPADATDVIVTDDLPEEGIILVNVVNPACEILDDLTVECTFDNIPVGESEEIVIGTGIEEGFIGTVTNTATITDLTSIDPFLGNNIASVELEIDDSEELFCGEPKEYYRLNGGEVIDNRGGPKDTLVGSQGPDLLIAGDYGDKLIGLRGNDCLIGGDGKDRLVGNSGNDALYGNGGKDKLHGNHGDDILYGGDNDDRIFAGHGDDDLFGNDGKDKLYGGSGQDDLDGGDHYDFCHGGSGKSDTAVNCEKVRKVP